MKSKSSGRSPIAQQIYTALGEYLRRDPASLRPDDSLRDDLGLDSLMTIELLYELESAFDLQIPDEDFMGLVTIGDVVAYIEKHKAPIVAESPTGVRRASSKGRDKGAHEKSRSSTKSKPVRKQKPPK